MLRLTCLTDDSAFLPGVEFDYLIDEANGQITVSRWGETTDIEFGREIITYRTRGMGMKMYAAIQRSDWSVTLRHSGGDFVVTARCKPRTD